MSKMSDLKGRLHALEEIRSILNAMKNLSIVEMNKVSHFEASQIETARSIEDAFADFERSFEIPSSGSTSKNRRLYILIGSERGFCGAFNEAVLERFETEVSHHETVSRILVVGRKIAMKLDGDPRVLDALDGPSTAEEIPGVILDLAGRLAKFPELEWAIVHHEGENSSGKTSVVDPFSRSWTNGGKRYAYPPLLNVTPEELYPQLLEQYLFSVLYRAFYLSFLEENRERLRHMEGALDALEIHLSQLRREGNALRQEEITEELEVILLGVDGKSGDRLREFPGLPDR